MDCHDKVWELTFVVQLVVGEVKHHKRWGETDLICQAC
jgi:hypothetical protein